MAAKKRYIYFIWHRNFIGNIVFPFLSSFRSTLVFCYKKNNTNRFRVII